MKKTLYAILLLGSFFSAAGQKNKNTLLWQISGKGLKDTSYLFGTMHIMCGEDLKLSKNLIASFNKSKTVVLEIANMMDSMTDPAMALQIMGKLMIKGKKLSDLYTPEEYRRLTKFVNDSLPDMAMLWMLNFKPEFYSMLFWEKMMDCPGNKRSYEIEFEEMAEKQGMEEKGMESISEQIAVFDSVPIEDQAKELLKLLDEWDKEKGEFIELIGIYKKQDIDELARISAKGGSTLSDNVDIFLNNRNKKWIPKIEAMAREKSCFFAFGAAHLGGENGVVNLLRKAGYTLTPLDN